MAARALGAMRLSVSMTPAIRHLPEIGVVDADASYPRAQHLVGPGPRADESRQKGRTLPYSSR